MVKVPDGALYQERLCWRDLAAIYWAGLDKFHNICLSIRCFCGNEQGREKHDIVSFLCILHTLPVLHNYFVSMTIYCYSVPTIDVCLPLWNC
jgi:hypothetical protein